MLLFINVVAAVIFQTFCQDDLNQYHDGSGLQKHKRVVYDDPDPYKNLINWLTDGKADISKVQIVAKSEGYRTLIAKQFIRQNEIILFIPRTHYLSLDEVKKSCLINRKMIQINHIPNNIQTYFVNHLLQENRRKNSFWKPYIDVLPTDVSGFPTYFDEEQLALLQGSPTLFTVMQQRQVFQEEYDNLYNAIGEFRKFNYSYPDFVKFRILTISRSFPTFINDKEQEQLLVPLADFVNHDNNGFILYGYDKDLDGFIMQAARNIHAGEELFYNYGHWSNKYFFMNYGFALKTNPMNQFDFDICLDNSDRLLKLKLQMTSNYLCFGNRLVNETDHDTFRQALGTVRFAMMNKLHQLLTLEDATINYNFWPGWHTVPQSIDLEKRTFTHMKKLLENSINNYSSTIEDDERRLRDPNTPEFRKHIITLTLMEKQIIKRHIDVCTQMLEVIDKSSDELRNIMRYYHYREIARYVNTVIIPIKTEEEQN